ncbi:MAG: hypothetical protein ACYC6L_16340, partial [Anaerolineae bacterium]
QGAQPSEPVAQMLQRNGVWAKYLASKNSAASTTEAS